MEDELSGGRGCCDTTKWRPLCCFRRWRLTSLAARTRTRTRHRRQRVPPLRSVCARQLRTRQTCRARRRCSVHPARLSLTVPMESSHGDRMHLQVAVPTILMTGLTSYCCRYRCQLVPGPRLPIPPPLSPLLLLSPLRPLSLGPLLLRPLRLHLPPLRPPPLRPPLLRPPPLRPPPPHPPSSATFADSSLRGP